MQAGRIVVRLADLDDALAVLRQVPELEQGRSDGDYVRRLTGHASLVLIAERAGQAIGFKIGYPLSPGVFYSWVGGVLPVARGCGAARRLLEMQEQLVRAAGHARIAVKTAPRFAAMVGLLEDNGYVRASVTGVEADIGELVYAKELR